MQTNYTPNMSLRNKIVTGVILAGIGLVSLVNGGCETQQTNPVLTSEQRDAIFKYRVEEEERKNEQKEDIFKYRVQEQEKQKLQGVQTQQPTKPQTPPNDWVWDVYKGIFIRAGAGILEGEYWLNKD